jgi:hypothetical protein
MHGFLECDEEQRLNFAAWIRHNVFKTHFGSWFLLPL